MAAGEPNFNYSSSQSPNRNNLNDPRERQLQERSALVVPKIIVVGEESDGNAGKKKLLIDKKIAKDVSYSDADERGFGGASAFPPIEDVLFPLLSWRTYDNTLSHSVNLADSADFPKERSLLKKEELGSSDVDDVKQTGNTGVAASAAPTAHVPINTSSRQQIHYTQSKQISWTLPYVHAIVDEARKTQRKPGCAPDSNRSMEAKLRRLCFCCSKYNRSGERGKETYSLYRKPELIKQLDARRRHTYNGVSGIRILAAEGKTDGKTDVKSDASRISSQMQRRLPRLHDLSPQTYTKKVEDPTREPVPEDFFDFLNQLGSGSYGKVYLVRYRETSEKFAIKVHLTMQRRRAETELRTMLMLRPSPFLVCLHSHFSTMLALYMVMEYVPGGSLTQKLTAPFSVVAAAFYSAQIALALMHIHSHGVLYRDLKPDNILFTSKYYIKVCDFGTCHPGIFGEKLVKISAGTPRYWSPEKLQQEPYGRPSDWWSLGVILYQMLTAEFPFISPKLGYEAFADAVVNTEPNYRVDLAQDAVSACKGFLAKDPKERLGGPEESKCLLNHPLYRRFINWPTLKATTCRPPPMYAKRSASMPSYDAYGRPFRI